MAKVGKSYDCKTHYHLGKANKVANALSQRLAINIILDKRILVVL